MKKNRFPSPSGRIEEIEKINTLLLERSLPLELNNSDIFERIKYPLSIELPSKKFFFHECLLLCENRAQLANSRKMLRIARPFQDLSTFPKMQMYHGQISPREKSKPLGT